MKNVTFAMTVEDAEFLGGVIKEKAAQLALAVKARNRATRVSAMFDQAKCFRVANCLRDATKLAEFEALDRAYADSDAFHLARQDPAPHDYVDEMADLRKAALNRGQP